MVILEFLFVCITTTTNKFENGLIIRKMIVVGKDRR